MSLFQYNKFSFETWIMNTCKSSEWGLRKFLKKKLGEAGFSWKEDDYVSVRCERNNKFRSIHNLLFIRGNPKICLVAHSDCCRDYRMDGQIPEVHPELKNWGTDEHTEWIIQDRDCEVQLAGDDRLGIAIASWIALNTGYDLAILITTDEECGMKSAYKCKFEELREFELLVQLDRGNRTNELVTQIGHIKLCSDQVTKRLLKIAEDMGCPRTEVTGLITDVFALRSVGICEEAINMTIGYMDGHSNSEYIITEEAKVAMKYTSEIIKHYDLNY